MMYLTPQQATSRLSERYGLDSTPYIGDLIMAGEELHGLAPFKPTVDLDDPPEALIDWVALRAHELRRGREDPPPASRISAADVTVWVDNTRQTMSGLITPYLRYTGRSA